jgi:hypothetical protein
MGASRAPAGDPGRLDGLWLMILGLVLLLWAASLLGIDPSDLGDYGMLPELGWTWYAAVACLLLGAAGLLGGPAPRPVLAAAYIGTLVLLLYATVPLATELPRYPWTYKHIGVTRYIEGTGALDPSIDIYHRWPGFFAVSAFFSRLAGQPNPIAYAAWAEPFFTLVSTMLVGAVARVVTRSVRTAGLAAILFALANWVNQLYYAPQALAFTLSLAIVLILFSTLVRDDPARVGALAALAAGSGAGRSPRSGSAGRRHGGGPSGSGPCCSCTPRWSSPTSSRRTSCCRASRRSRCCASYAPGRCSRS